MHPWEKSRFFNPGIQTCSAVPRIRFAVPVRGGGRKEKTRIVLMQRQKNPGFKSHP